MAEERTVIVRLEDDNGVQKNLTVATSFNQDELDEVLNVIMDSLGKIEDFMGSMLGVAADTTLNGSIFNSNTGLFNQMKSRALATMQMPIDIASDIKGKISTTKKMMDEAKK